MNHQGYVVDWFLDGQEIWNYLEAEWTQYTLAIFDWMLPGLSGLELCKRLRSPQLQPRQLQVGSLTLDYGTYSVTRQDCTHQQVIPLTLKEFQLLEYLMKHPNQIISRDQLMNQP